MDCNPSKCPLYRERKGVASPEVKAEAERLMASPELESWTVETFHKEITGEDSAILGTFYLELTGKLNDPQLKQIIVLKGEPGGGKTTIADRTSRRFKRKKVGRFSEHALDYSGLSCKEILYLQEIIGLGFEEKGVSTLRFLSADDEGYVVEIAVKKEGKFTTEEHKIPPMTVITTTSHVSIEKQLGRRVWEINVDESEEQTRKVLEDKAKKEAMRFEKVMGKNHSKHCERDTRLPHRYGGALRQRSSRSN